MTRTTPLLLLLAAGCAAAPSRDTRFRLPAAYNFAFYDTFGDAARSFYAAHYAHFRVYEVAMDEDPGPAFERTTAEIRHLIEDPPKYEPLSDLIAPRWTKIGWPTARAMDWTHMLHSQLYDILTDDRVANKRAAGERAIAYYLANGDVAFSTRGYGHRWMMGGGTWAGTFAREQPAINGILWAYHWHHAAVYEALMEPDSARRRVELARVLRVFEDSVLANPPSYMPLTAEVAPRFSRMFPAAAHIFDNLHMMHDVVNDIMLDPVRTDDERAFEIERMRRNMTYRAQDAVVAPGMPMSGDHAMGESGSRVPTQLDDGSWLPQGHPDARMATMEELMAPLLPAGAAPAAHHHDEETP